MTDLATLRELPRRESFIQQNNAIYGVGDGDVDQELALLPHIRFEDLLITKFLGRGAFGEVFEGTTCNLPGSTQYHTKVAVKVSYSHLSRNIIAYKFISLMGFDGSKLFSLGIPNVLWKLYILL